MDEIGASFADCLGTDRGFVPVSGLFGEILEFFRIGEELGGGLGEVAPVDELNGGAVFVVPEIGEEVADEDASGVGCFEESE